MLNGFELHVYNRSQLYSRLEKLFGLGSDIFVESDSDEEREMKSNRDRIRYVRWMIVSEIMGPF